MEKIEKKIRKETEEEVDEEKKEKIIEKLKRKNYGCESYKEWKKREATINGSEDDWVNKRFG